MPNFDGTGPMGQGAMTGRRRGRCRDNQTIQIEKTENQSAETKDIVNRLGRGGRPRGGGFGFGGAFGYRFSGKGRGRGYGNR